MSSSTSSSDAKAQRRIFGRIFITVALGMSIAMAMVQGFVYAMGGSSESLLGRVLQAHRAIPQIADEEGDLVMFFGSSMTEAGFSPREFDRDIRAAGGNTMSFNFGFGGLNPLFQDYISRRMAESFQAEDRRLKLIMIEFNPFQTTVSRRNLQRAQEDSYLAILTSEEELWDIVVDDPENGIRKALIRYIRDGISAEMITTFLFAEPFRVPPGSAQVERVEDPEAEARLDEIFEILGQRFEEEYPDYDGSDWYYPWRGGGTNLSERAEDTLELFDEYYELTQTDYRMTVDRLQRIESADIEELHFDPELVERFIAVVEIIMLPKNTDWIKNPPEAMQRQAAAVRRIEEATGIKVRNHQQVDGVTNDMFSDTTHLNRYYGATRYTEFLAREFADDLN